VARLTVPATGSVYFDTSAIIFSVEKIEPLASRLRPYWLAARSGDLALMTSELTLLETLVKPIQSGDDALEQSFRALLLQSRELQMIPITTAVLERAAHLRAEFGVKTPDAIHAASALLLGCGQFVTHDSGFRRVAGLPVTMITE